LRGSSGKAVSEVARGESSANTPIGSDSCKRLENEIPIFQPIMGNGQRPGAKIASAPKNYIEIEHSGAPMLCPPSPEYSFHCLDSAEHLRGFEIAFDQRDGVGEIPSGPADSSVKNDR